MKEGLVSTWNKIQEIGNREVSLDGAKEILSRDITSFFINSHDREIARCQKWILIQRLNQCLEKPCQH